MIVIMPQTVEAASRIAPRYFNNLRVDAKETKQGLPYFVVKEFPNQSDEWEVSDDIIY